MYSWLFLSLKESLNSKSIVNVNCWVWGVGGAVFAVVDPGVNAVVVGAAVIAVVGAAVIVVVDAAVIAVVGGVGGAMKKICSVQKSTVHWCFTHEKLLGFSHSR